MLCEFLIKNCMSSWFAVGLSVHTLYHSIRESRGILSQANKATSVRGITLDSDFAQLRENDFKKKEFDHKQKNFDQVLICNNPQYLSKRAKGSRRETNFVIEFSISCYQSCSLHVKSLMDFHKNTKQELRFFCIRKCFIMIDTPYP